MYYIIIILYYIVSYNIILYYKDIGNIGIVGLDMPNYMCMLFKLRLGVLSKTLSHMWGKLNIPMSYLMWDY